MRDTKQLPTPGIPLSRAVNSWSSVPVDGAISDAWVVVSAPRIARSQNLIRDDRRSTACHKLLWKMRLTPSTNQLTRQASHDMVLPLGRNS